MVEANDIDLNSCTLAHVSMVHFFHNLSTSVEGCVRIGECTVMEDE